ncbi:RNI-like protein, partial [Wolfiporia cocos MD-104 SS10]
MSTLDLPTVGTRLCHSGHLGTVRFVGQVEGASGIWLGVEWDDPQRGKHDGVKDGKRYFSCIVPNAGSFIRPASTTTYGRSFLTALVSKYIEEIHGSVETVILGSSNGAIEVEVVGLDKIRSKLSRLERLREVSLDGENVAYADPPGAIAKTCPGIRGLDLSRNLLPSWDMVASIASQLPQLQRLALNQNRLSPLQGTSYSQSAFCDLQELQLNATLTTWEEMEAIIKYMPVLRSVEMGYNRLQHLSHGNRLGAQSGMDTLAELNLDGNALHSWRTICAGLRSYPGLRRLILTSNCIETIEPLTDAVSEAALVNLKHLSLSCNRLHVWSDIDAIPSWCPALESLSLTGNPLVEDPELGKHSRQFAIARIASLRTLDAAPISTRERTDSELFYISHVSRHGPPDAAAREREHPRLKALCIKHGSPDIEPPAAQARHDTLSSRLIEVKMHRYTAPSPP